MRSLLFASLAAVVLAGSAEAQSWQPPQARSGDSQQAAPSAYPPPPTVVIRDEKNGAAPGAEREPTCADPNSDLCQQARMALASNQLVSLTAAETVFLILTFLGAIALGVFGLLTSRAQLRANVHLRTAEISDVAGPNDAGIT